MEYVCILGRGSGVHALFTVLVVNEIRQMVKSRCIRQHLFCVRSCF